jgi:hypothetical protein
MVVKEFWQFELSYAFPGETWERGKNVRNYDTLPTNMHCEYIDEIIGTEANLLTFLFMSNYDMTAGARAHLRNQAVKLGGNSVEIQQADFMSTSSTIFNRTCV